jgi:hypothetical protein
MQTLAYEGYFVDDHFYVSGKVTKMPEHRRVVITILEDIQSADTRKMAAWNEFKRMSDETAHENLLLDNDAFKRVYSGRELIDFFAEVDKL